MVCWRRWFFVSVFGHVLQQWQLVSFIKMTNLNVSQFELIWNGVQDYVLTTNNVGRGQRCKESPKDALSIHAAYDDEARWKLGFSFSRFKLKEPTFEGVVWRFPLLIVNKVSEVFINAHCNLYTMAKHTEKNNVFNPFERHAMLLTLRYKKSMGLVDPLRKKNDFSMERICCTVVRWT